MLQFHLVLSLFVLQSARGLSETNSVEVHLSFLQRQVLKPSQRITIFSVSVVLYFVLIEVLQLQIFQFSSKVFKQSTNHGSLNQSFQTQNQSLSHTQILTTPLSIHRCVLRQDQPILTFSNGCLWKISFIARHPCLLPFILSVQHYLIFSNAQNFFYVLSFDPRRNRHHSHLLLDRSLSIPRSSR